LPRAQQRIQPQVREDLLDRRPLQDRRDDLHLPGAAPRATLQADVEDALQQSRPADARRAARTSSASLAAAAASIAGPVTSDPWGTTRDLSVALGASTP